MTVRKMNPFVAPRTVRRGSAAAAPELSPVLPPAADERRGIDIKKIILDLKTDDYILLGIIAALFFEGCDDYILLAALGYLFVMGII